LSFGAYSDTGANKAKIYISKEEPPKLKNPFGNTHDDEDT
jgi:hypothetical protein